MDIGRIARDETLAGLIRKLAVDRVPGVVFLSGLWGSSARLVATEIVRRTARPLLYVTAHLEQADHAREDIDFFLGQPGALLSAWETLPGDGPAAGEIEAERLRLCAQFAPRAAKDGTTGPCVVVAPIQALMQTVPTPEALEAWTLRLRRGDERDPEALATWLADRGFVRLDLVEAPGDYAWRGDILDVFAPGETHPVRLEFFGERLEALRRFDVSTQRSIETRASFAVCATPAGGADGAARTSFLSYLPPETVVMLDGPVEIQEMGRVFYERLNQPENLFPVEEVFRLAASFGQIHSARFGGAATPRDEVLHFEVRSLSRFEGKAAEAVAELLDLSATRDVCVVCDNEGERQRLVELLTETAGHPLSRIEAVLGHVRRGFDWVGAETAIVGHHEVFQRQRPRRRIRRSEASRPLESWLELLPGDFVVHATHGIARFRAIAPQQKGDTDKVEEFLTLEFADQAVLHVPVSQIDLVQKYVGAGAVKPKLSKLGGSRWKKTKARVGESVAELAGSLLRIQAARAAHEGVAYPADTAWQREYEEAFPYQETEDQLVVAAEIKDDLGTSKPMDRLLCGDVGYGKTELAMRAAFKVAEYGKQVAVLVPTTVLAEQHYETFTERMADYPFALGCLSRFRTGREQKKLLEAIRKGRVDIVIGTHRLLSKDVVFADLGLLVIDEEQRFGVEHKERLKGMRATVEVLTMTATPIPRTLHMAMLGIRDISSLATPPVDRRSIATQVCRFDDQLVRDAIIRELNRDGQVYFVHNFVRSIHGVADRIRRIVPECRIVVGHGQMKDRELEGVMSRFLKREADVLVSTTIIESGIDVPTANTIFIDRADRFGLSDLHQLRGRVGRSQHRAYCYLLLAPNRALTPKSARRLKSIEEFSELGAGFRIAMRDLEIRGAGNILGPEQSGHIAAVGYDMYCRLLEGAVRRMRAEPEPIPPPVHLEFGVAAFVPRRYISSERGRIEIYRRIVACATLADLEQLRTDIADAYGSPPAPVERLLELAEIRVLARRWKIDSIIAQTPDLVFRVSNLAGVQGLFAEASGPVRMPDPRTVHLRLRPAYFEPPTLLAYLRRLLAQEPAAQETVA